MDKWKKVLLLSPHTDDAEIAMGGTIAKLRMEGKEIHHAVFSICEESVPQGYERDILAQECISSNAVFGIKLPHLMILRYKVRYFPENRQAILEEMVMLRKMLEPDVVFLPSVCDIHQDHEIVRQEGIRAFLRHADILGYGSTDADMFYEITPGLLKKKLEALSKYNSQQFRRPFNWEVQESLARVNGMFAGCELAEAFEVIRMMI
jgi:LmbE family N-acetylglucosaminyl deacetylase